MKMIIGIDPYNGDVTGEVSATIGVNCGLSTGRNGVIVDDDSIGGNGSRPSYRGDGQLCQLRIQNKVGALNCMHDQQMVMVEHNSPTHTHAHSWAMDRASYNQGRNALYDFAVIEEISPTLIAKGTGLVCTNK